MKFFSTLLLLTLLCFGHVGLGQSVLNPADSVITYNGTLPAQPANGTIGKWIRTHSLGWNTDSFKCYIYKGNTFRLRYPRSYNPTANDGKKYPMLMFFHGKGESGPTTDNEYQMYHGGDAFNAAANNGLFDGYIMFMENVGGYWGPGYYSALAELTDYMTAHNKLDPFHVVANGLSAGGQGTWEMMFSFPTYIAADMPISDMSIYYKMPDTVNKYKYTPIWNSEGGLDGSPAPATGEQVRNAFNAAGANFRYKEYPTLGHGCWDSVWQEPDFWPYVLRAYSSNPWTQGGRTSFCYGDAINLTVGLMAGFQAYQWRKDSVIIAGATSNTITVTQLGKYDARVERNGIWSDWSHTPVIIAITPPTVTPPISIAGVMSDALPAVDRNFVTLQVPDSGYTSYTWKRVGSDSVLGIARTLQVTRAGQYIVQVTQLYGCSSNYSPAFTVINANGTNAPSAASNVTAQALSFTQTEVDWVRNPTPVNHEAAFEIYRSLTTGGPYAYIGQAHADSIRYIDNNLTPNTKYYYVVRTIDSTAAAPLSNEAGVTTTSDKTPPTAPRSLTVVNTTQSSVNLSWNSSIDNVSVKNYLVYVNGVKSFSTSDTTFLITALASSTQYSFYVVALDGSGNVSLHSNQVSAASVNNGFVYNYYTTTTGWSVLPNFTTLTPVSSGQMPNVSIANATQALNFGYTWSGFINIPVAGTYTFGTTSDDGSALWFNKSSASGTPTVNNDGLHGSVLATGTVTLQPGIYPVFIEFFQNGGGSGMSVSWACSNLFGDNNQHVIADSYFAGVYTSAGTAPAKPTVIKAIAISYNKVNITWTDNSNSESGFEVYRSTSSTGTYAIVGTTGANITTFVDSSASAATTYFYKVQAINQYGVSGYDAASLGGIQYAYYSNFTANNLITLSSLTPALTGTLSNISLSPATSTTNYAFKYTGSINVPATGAYTFYTASDDGSNLYIGGFDSTHLVVKNDFLQGVTERSGVVTLTAGSYPIYITYFQQGGGAGLTASYQGPGIAKQNIPDAAFVNAQSTTTTFALPSVPLIPYNVSASVLSSSSIKLGWADSSSTVTGFNIYRSAGDSTHFILLTGAIAASITSYSDTALLSNLAYYYKISAVGVAGNSAYSARVIATTGDNRPVITKLSSQSARYGITTAVPVSATSMNSGTLSFTGYNIPAFASVTDKGNRTATLTITPTAANQGNYTNLSIVVADAFGGKDTTVFNLNVNNNFSPTLDTVANYTINENDTLNIALNGHNVNSSDTMTVSVSNVPAGYTLVQAGNGSAVLKLHPGYAAAGVYTIQAKVNDNNGLSVTRTFVLTVRDKDPNSVIYTRFSAGDATGTPWNTIGGVTSTGFKDASGNTTTVGLSLSPTWWFSTFNGGPTTGNNSGLYPDPVLQDYYYFGIFGGPDSVNSMVTGLDTSKYYNLTFFSTSAWTGVPDNGNTTFRSGVQKVSLYVQNNTKNTASLNNLKPAADGTISFTMAKASNATVGYLNALLITQQFDDGTAPAAPNSLTAQNVANQGIQLGWNNTAYNATSYELWRAGSSASFSLLTTLSGGKVNSYTDSSISGNTKYYYKVRATNSHGVSSFTDSVTITSLNRVPKINAIANIALKNNQQTSVNVTTVDDASAVLTLTASNLPPFASFTDNGNGTGTINVVPSAGVVGVYPGVTVTVTDAVGATASTSFTVAVTEKNVSSIYVNFSDGVNPAPKPWNTFAGAPFANTGLTNLIDDSNNPTTVGMKLLDGFQWYSSTGNRPQNGQEAYPAVIIRTGESESTTATRRIQINGLSSSKKYNFVFFNSHEDGTKGLTNFSINGQTVALNATYNINKTVQINGISPDSTGNVTISVAKDASSDYAYISTIVIQSYDTAQSILLNPTALRAIANSTSTIKLQFEDRSYNETAFEVWRASDSTGAYALVKTLAPNTTTYTDVNLVPNTTYYYSVRAVRNMVYSDYSNVLTTATNSYAVYINFTDTSEALAPWNNLNRVPNTGDSFKHLKDSSGTVSSVNMNVTGTFTGYLTQGVVTGNNSGVYPDLVMRDYCFEFPGIVGGLQFAGLDMTKKYDFTFFASTIGYGDNTGAYVVNGDTVLMDASLNSTGLVTKYGVTPDNTGAINVNVLGYHTSLGGFLNAMVVQAHTPSTSTAPALPNGGQATTVSQHGVSQGRAATLDAVATTQDTKPEGKFNIYPNPFTSSFTISVPVSEDGDNAMVNIYDAAGKVVYVKEYYNLIPGTNELTVYANQGLSQRGVYFVRVVYNGGKTIKTVKLVKE